MMMLQSMLKDRCTYTYTISYQDIPTTLHDYIYVCVCTYIYMDIHVYLFVYTHTNTLDTFKGLQEHPDGVDLHGSGFGMEGPLLSSRCGWMVEIQHLSDIKY